MARRLLEMGADLRYHDPYVPRWEVGTTALECSHLDLAVDAADLVVILQNHRAYDLDALVKQARWVLDTRGCVDGPTVERL